MKLAELLEAGTPFVGFGSWTIFEKDADIQGFTNFGVPVSGPALMAHTRDDNKALLLGIDPDGKLSPSDQIIVTIIVHDDGVTFKKSWPDSKEGYKEAKKYAEKLRKGESPA